MPARNLHCRLAHARVLSYLDRRARYSRLQRPLKVRNDREMQLTAVLGPLLLAIVGRLCRRYGAPERRRLKRSGRLGDRVGRLWRCGGRERSCVIVRGRRETVCTRVTGKVTESASPRAATRRVAREPPAAVIGGGCIECELRCLCKRPYAAMCGRQTARVSAVCSHALRDCQTLTLLSATVLYVVEQNVVSCSSLRSRAAGRARGEQGA